MEALGKNELMSMLKFGADRCKEEGAEGGREGA